MQDRQRPPVLVVAGSMSEATRRQVDNALCRGRAEVVDIDARMVSDSAEQERVCRRAGLRAVKSASTHIRFYAPPSRRRSTVNRRAVRKIRDEPSAIGRATEPAAWRVVTLNIIDRRGLAAVSDRRRYRYRRRQRAWR